MLAARYSHPRAGYRSAQDLIFFPSFSQSPCAFRGADGGTVGGSAYDDILLFVAWACGAERGHSSTSRSWRWCRCQRSSRVSQDRIQPRWLGADRVHIQFLMVVVVGEVFKIYPLDRIQQRFGGVEHVSIPVPGGGLHVLPDPGGSRFSAVSREEAGQGVFRTLLRVKKSPKSAGSPSAELLGEVSAWTPAAYEAHHVGRVGDAL